jgi:fatty acid-binding protein DegV
MMTEIAIDATSPGARKPIRIVTDSLAWLPAEVVHQYDVTVVPLHVSFGDEQFTETVDITNEEFYRRLRTGTVQPTTSQPSPGVAASRAEQPESLSAPMHPAASPPQERR